MDYLDLEIYQDEEEVETKKRRGYKEPTLKEKIEKLNTPTEIIKSGWLICNSCADNQEGYCVKYKKWCNHARSKCSKIKKENLLKIADKLAVEI